MDHDIPVYRPSLDGNERKYVNACLDSSWISSKGEYVDRFERQFAAYVGVEQAVSVSNGTVGLHLALLALGIGAGDEVIVPTFTYIASVNAISYCNAKPVFVDSLKETWQMDPQAIARSITARTKAIMVVHLYGHPCDMSAIGAIAKAHGLLVIEDCAEAFGSYYKGVHVGGFGDVGVFSFYGNKTITTGEGGMVVMRDPRLYERAIQLRGQGVSKQRQYWHECVGYNYRMTNLCAAIGVAQLERAEEFLAKKREIAQWYEEGLTGLPVSLHTPVGDVIHSYWMCSLLVEDGAERDALRAFLSEKGIETRPLFFPVHTMQMYERQEVFPVAEDLGRRGINLPSWPGLKQRDVERICSYIRAFIQAPPQILDSTAELSLPR